MMRLNLISELLQTQQFGEDGAPPWTDTHSSSAWSPPPVAAPVAPPAPVWSPPAPAPAPDWHAAAAAAQGAAIANAIVYAPTPQPDYSAYNTPIGGYFADLTAAAATAWNHEQHSMAQAASAAGQALGSFVVDVYAQPNKADEAEQRKSRSPDGQTYCPPVYGHRATGNAIGDGLAHQRLFDAPASGESGELLHQPSVPTRAQALSSDLNAAAATIWYREPSGIQAASAAGQALASFINAQAADTTNQVERSKLRSPDGQTYCPPSEVYGHRDAVSASGDWFANQRMFDAPAFGESGETMQYPPVPTRAQAASYNPDEQHSTAQAASGVVAWGKEGFIVSASGDRFPNNRMIDAVASAFGESGEMMQRPAMPTRAQAANYNTAPHVGQALLSANAPTILQHERTAEAGQSPEVNPAIEKARQEMALLLQDPLNQELLAYYTAHIEQKQATWTPSPWSSTPPSLAQLPDTEQGQFMTERYGVELATQLYRLDLAMRQVRDSYAQAVDQAVRDKPTSPSQAGPVGLVTHVEPPPAWWDVHKVERATGVDRFGTPDVRFEFNLQVYTDHYLQQDSEAARLFKALYGDQITTTQFKPPGADSETIRYQHIGGEQFQVRLGEQVEYGPNLSRTKWIATSVGDSDTGELIRIDLARAPKMHDAGQVFFDPTMGWVTTTQNIDSAEFFDKAFPILVGAAAGFFAGPALAGMVNLGGNVVATAAFGAATSTAVSGLIVNGRIDFGDVIKSALTAAFTAGITDALKLDTMGTAINADGVRVVTDWGQRLLGAAGQITLSGFAAELSGADFADGLKGGVASVVSQEIVRGLQIKIGEMGDLSAAAKSQLGIATRALGAGIRAALTDGDPLQALAIEYLQGLGVNMGDEIHAAQEQQTALAGMDHEYEIYSQQDSSGNMPINSLPQDNGVGAIDPDSAAESLSPLSGNDISVAAEGNSPAPTLDEEPVAAPSFRPSDNYGDRAPSTVRAGDYNGSLELVARAQLGPHATQREINAYVGQLFELNQIRNARTIPPGRELILPSESTPPPTWGLTMYAGDIALGERMRAEQAARETAAEQARLNAAAAARVGQPLSPDAGGVPVTDGGGAATANHPPSNGLALAGTAVLPWTLEGLLAGGSRVLAAGGELVTQMTLAARSVSPWFLAVIPGNAQQQTFNFNEGQRFVTRPGELYGSLQQLGPDGQWFTSASGVALVELPSGQRVALSPEQMAELGRPITTPNNNPYPTRPLINPPHDQPLPLIPGLPADQVASPSIITTPITPGNWRDSLIDNRSSPEEGPITSEARQLELFTGERGAQVPGALGVGPTDTAAIAVDARNMPNIASGSQSRVVASNPFIPPSAGGTGQMMDYLPEAARVTQPGGQIVINGNSANRYFTTTPSSDQLSQLGLEIVYEGTLLPEFRGMTFVRTDGSPIDPTTLRSIVFIKKP